MNKYKVYLTVLRSLVGTKLIVRVINFYFSACQCSNAAGIRPRPQSLVRQQILSGGYCSSFSLLTLIATVQCKFLKGKGKLSDYEFEQKLEIVFAI